MCIVHAVLMSDALTDGELGHLPLDQVTLVLLLLLGRGRGLPGMAGAEEPFSHRTRRYQNHKINQKRNIFLIRPHGMIIFRDQRVAGALVHRAAPCPLPRTLLVLVQHGDREGRESLQQPRVPRAHLPGQVPGGEQVGGEG